MLATDAKMQKMEPDPIPFMTDESFRLSVQWPLVLKVMLVGEWMTI